MSLNFYKYQGTGNDFVVIDDRKQLFDVNNHELVAKLCDRRFGIGADGLMLLQNSTENNIQNNIQNNKESEKGITKNGFDFHMIYYNSDGQQSSMCGNGGRCMVAFAKYLGIISEKTTFTAIDGVHEAQILDNVVSLKMNDVETVVIGKDFFFLNTGSPHYVSYVENIENYKVFEQGKAIRYSETYQPKGTNVNFISEISPDYLFVRTYERGVEDETFSCGTGVTAAAIAYSITKQHVNHVINNIETTDNTKSPSINHIKIKTLGGELAVSFEFSNGKYHDIYLKGAAKLVFEGKYVV